MAVVDDKGRLLGQLKRKELIWLLTTLDRLEQPDREELEEPPEAKLQHATDNSSAPNRAGVPKPKFLRSGQRHRQILAQQMDKSLKAPE